MILLKRKELLRRNMSSIFNKLVCKKQISIKLIKKVCGVLLRAQIVPFHWIAKPSEEIEAKSSDPGLMINVTLNDYSTSCVLDTGATFTLIPYQVWNKLKINASFLNTKISFNINSASHRVENAVLGQIDLTFKIRNADGNSQIINQNCLVLRPVLELQYVLLGNDFLSSNDVQIIFSQKKKTVLINKKHVCLLTQTGTTNFTNVSALSVNASDTNTFMAPNENDFKQHLNMKPQDQSEEETEREEENRYRSIKRERRNHQRVFRSQKGMVTSLSSP